MKKGWLGLLIVGCLLGVAAFVKVFFFMPNTTDVSQNTELLSSTVAEDPRFVELFGTVDKLAKLDTDKDGVPDISDTDVDNDGTANADDTDVDGDGTLNQNDPSTAATAALQGEAGAQGATGATGAAGATGTAGAKGEKGETGTAGANGTDGADGADGATGATGAQGPAGPQGATGATGAQGLQGAAGTVGAVTDDGVIDTTLTAGDLDIQLALAAGSGMIKLSGGLSLTNTCTTGQILKWNGSAWTCQNDNQRAEPWALAGNASTDPASQFIGTTDAQPLVFRTNNTEAARFDTTGKFGIGTTTPGYTLDVNGTLRLGMVPTVTDSTTYLVRNSTTGQVGQQSILEKSPLKIAANVGNGVPVQLDELRVQLSTSGNRSLQISASTGTLTLSGTSTNNYIGSAAGAGGASSSLTSYMRQSSTFTTSWTYWQGSADFTMHGSTQEIYINDETNNRIYHVLLIVGLSFNNNKIVIERYL